MASSDGFAKAGGGQHRVLQGQMAACAAFAKLSAPRHLQNRHSPPWGARKPANGRRVVCQMAANDGFANENVLATLPQASARTRNSPSPGGSGLRFRLGPETIHPLEGPILGFGLDPSRLFLGPMPCYRLRPRFNPPSSRNPDSPPTPIFLPFFHLCSSLRSPIGRERLVEKRLELKQGNSANPGLRPIVRAPTVHVSRLATCTRARNLHLATCDSRAICAREL